MRTYFYCVLKILIVLLALLEQEALFALDCSELFSYVQSKSVSDSKTVSTLSQIPSSYQRFVHGASHLVSEDSFIKIDTEESSNDLDQQVYPVVDVDIFFKTGAETILKPALILDSKTMLVVVDKNIDRDSIDAVFYQDLNLKTVNEREYEGKKIYTLLSDIEFEIPDTSLENRQDQKTIREFLSLYNVPQDDSDINSFLFPQVGSVVKVFIRKNSIQKDGFLYDALRLQHKMFSEEDYTPVKKDLGITDKLIRRAEKNLTEENGRIKILNEVYRFIENLQYNLGINALSKADPDNEPKDIKVGRIIAKILSSSRVRESYSGLFVPSRNLYKVDVEDMIVGFDEALEQLKDIFLDDDTKITIERIRSRYGIGKDEEIKIAFKKIIWAIGRRIYKADKKFFNKKESDGFEPDFVGYATIVSSNTIMTVSSVLKDIGIEDDEYFDDEVCIQNQSGFIDAVSMHHISYDNISSYVNVSFIRFPDGTFDNQVHAKLGYSNDKSRGILVTESEDDTRSVTLVDMCEDPDSCFYKVYPVKEKDLESSSNENGKDENSSDSTPDNPKMDNSVKGVINPSRKGFPLFGSDDKLIGFLRGSIKKPQVILIPEGVVEEVKALISKNPKLKIRGMNE